MLTKALLCLLCRCCRCRPSVLLFTDFFRLNNYVTCIMNDYDSFLFTTCISYMHSFNLFLHQVSPTHDNRTAMPKVADGLHKTTLQKVHESKGKVKRFEIHLSYRLKSHVGKSDTKKVLTEGSQSVQCLNPVKMVDFIITYPLS